LFIVRIFRRDLALQYNEVLSTFPGVDIPHEAIGCRHIYHLYVIRIPDRDKLKHNLGVNGIASAIYYPQPLHFTHPLRVLSYKPGDFPVSEFSSHHTLAIPIYPEMTSEQVQSLLDILESSLG
jgi:dTDP-4-amino-4,6-dideoxygalactose transaminase